jgi:hypothetical protein
VSFLGLAISSDEAKEVFGDKILGLSPEKSQFLDEKQLFAIDVGVLYLRLSTVLQIIWGPA